MAHQPPSSDVEKGDYSGSSSNNGQDDNHHGVLVAAQEPIPIQEVQPMASLSPIQENIFLIFITLTQLVQMIPLGAGINSGLAIGEALGASQIQSVWIVASYPLTQGAFVLVGKCFYPPLKVYEKYRKIVLINLNYRRSSRYGLGS